VWEFCFVGSVRLVPYPLHQPFPQPNPSGPLQHCPLPHPPPFALPCFPIAGCEEDHRRAIARSRRKRKPRKPLRKRKPVENLFENRNLRKPFKSKQRKPFNFTESTSRREPANQELTAPRTKGPASTSQAARAYSTDAARCRCSRDSTSSRARCKQPATGRQDQRQGRTCRNVRSCTNEQSPTKVDEQITGQLQSMQSASPSLKRPQRLSDNFT
jgi:hypothetical protein